jgi:endosialidase-like protein
MKTTTTLLPRRLALLAQTAVLSLAFFVAAPDVAAQVGNTATGQGTLVGNTGNYNTGDGFYALAVQNSGVANTAVGVNALYSNKSGTQNTASGAFALFSNTTGFNNAASGAYALYRSTTAQSNAANGAYALSQNTTGSLNTASGVYALSANTTGNDNTAIGYLALSSNTAGGNTALGSNSLTSNTTGSQNTASGFNALGSNTTGFSNTADGTNALFKNTAGKYNTATGTSALYTNTTGSNNVAMGDYSLLLNTTAGFNTAIGTSALYNNTGAINIALGYHAGYNLTTGSNNIDIGNAGVAGDAGRIRIGANGTQTATFVAGIYGKTVASATKVGVMIDSTGKLGTVVSSARFKEAIKPMRNASEALLALEPVTFRYKEELDPDGIPQFGLIAEQVEKVDPNLVVRDEDGKVSTVRYEAVNAMLLNEFLKEHGKVETLEAAVTRQQKMIAKQETAFRMTIAQQQKQIEALSAGLQKVNDQLQESRPVPRIVAND